MKRFITLFLSIFLIINILPTTIFGQTLSVKVDNVPVYFPDTQPTIIDGRTLIPVRFLSEQFGAEVIWDNSTRTVTITKEYPGLTIKPLNGQQQRLSNVLATVTLQIDNSLLNIAYLDKNTNKAISFDKIMDVTPILINDRTMLPARFIGVALGYNVDWEDSTRTVICNYTGIFDESFGLITEVAKTKTDEIIKTSLNGFYAYTPELFTKTAQTKISNFLNGDNTHKEELSAFILQIAYTNTFNELYNYYVMTNQIRSISEINNECYEYFTNLDISEQYYKYFKCIDTSTENFINSFLNGFKYQDLITKTI